MKLLKKLTLFILGIIIIGFLYVLIQPDNYNVSRSKIIKAPIATVFNTVNDLKTWEKWGPWHDEDSTIVVTYGTKTVGVGASDSWTSKDGPGNIETVAVVTNTAIEQKMQFNDYDPSTILWTFKELKEGTEVTWTIKEENAPLVFKMIAALSGGWDNMLGPMEAQGLDNLENLILEEVKLANSFTIGEVSKVNLMGNKFIGYYHKMKIDYDEIFKIFMNDIPKVGKYAMSSGLKYGDFTPASVYLKWDETTKDAVFYIGILLHKNLEAAKGMAAISLPKGEGVMVSKFGNYVNGDKEAHMAIDTFLKKHKKEMKYPIWELYMNDPTMVKPHKIQTDIYYPIK